MVMALCVGLWMVSNNVMEETQPGPTVSVWMRVCVPGILVSAAVRVKP